MEQMVEVLDSGTFIVMPLNAKHQVDFMGCESDLILIRVKPPFSLNLNHSERKNV
jgi:hypothetical protein